MATKAQAAARERRARKRFITSFIGRKIRHYVRDLGMEPKQAARVAYEEARAKGYKVGRPTKKNVDTFTVGLIGPGVERAASVASPRRRRGRASKRKRSKRNVAVDVGDVISFWREYADGQDFSRKAIAAGVSEIKGDPEYWASESMSKLADRVDAWKGGRASEGNPFAGPVIGDHVLAVEYRGGEGKKKASLWRHDFSKVGAKVIGLKDGSVLIKRGKKPLWRYFK